MDVFRDEHERKAHDVICTIKYGGRGGSVSTNDVREVGDILRGQPFRPAIPLPTRPVVMLPLPGKVE